MALTPGHVHWRDCWNIGRTHRKMLPNIFAGKAINFSGLLGRRHDTQRNGTQHYNTLYRVLSVAFHFLCWTSFCWVSWRYWEIPLKGHFNLMKHFEWQCVGWHCPFQELSVEHFFPTFPSFRPIYTSDCVVWICSLMRRARLIAVKMCFVCHQTFVAICALLKIERFLKSFFKFAQTGSEPRIFSFIFSRFADQLQRVPKTRKIFFEIVTRKELSRIIPAQFIQGPIL